MRCTAVYSMNSDPKILPTCRTPASPLRVISSLGIQSVISERKPCNDFLNHRLILSVLEFHIIVFSQYVLLSFLSFRKISLRFIVMLFVLIGSISLFNSGVIFYSMGRSKHVYLLFYKWIPVLFPVLNYD